MECYACEVVEIVTGYFKDKSDTLTKDILLYLYHTTTDDKLKGYILDWFNLNQYCITCGRKLVPYDYCEIHYELPYNNMEYFTDWLCLVCDRGEIEDYGDAIKKQEEDY